MNSDYKSLLDSIMGMPKQSCEDKNGTGILLVDPQKKFCDPDHANHYGTEETVKVAKEIEKLLPIFRDASIQVYTIYSQKNDFEAPDFFHYEPDGKDVLVMKDINTDSPFKEGSIKSIITRQGMKNIIVCGFNRAACAKNTAIDAVNTGKFNVFFLEDLTANNNRCPDEPWYKTEYMLKEADVKIISGAKLAANISLYRNNKPLI